MRGRSACQIRSGKRQEGLLDAGAQQQGAEKIVAATRHVLFLLCIARFPWQTSQGSLKPDHLQPAESPT